MAASFYLYPGTNVFPVTSYGAKADGTTDDSAAVQAAVTAAVAAGGGTVLFPVGVCVWNTGVVLPARNTGANAVIPVCFQGSVPPAVSTWNAAWPLPTANSAVKTALSSGGSLLSAAADGTSFFSAYHVTVRGLEFRAYDNPNCKILNLEYALCAEVDGVVINSNATDFWHQTQPSNSAATAVVMPRVANGAYSKIGSLTVINFYTGLYAGEHVECDSLNAYGCVRGVTFPGSEHGTSFGRICCQTCKYGLYFIGIDGTNPTSTTNLHRTHVGLFANERNEDVAWASTGSGGKDVYDPSNYGRGEVVAAYTNSVSSGTGHVGAYLTKSGATGLVVNEYGT